MKTTIITITTILSCLTSIVRADFDPHQLKQYRPFMTDMEGSAQRRHLHTIHSYRPYGSVVEIKKNISNDEFLEILKKKISSTQTFDGSKLKSIIFENALSTNRFYVDINTSSIVDLLEYYCTASNNLWYLEKREESIVVIIRNQNDNAEQADAGNRLSPVPDPRR